MANRSELQGTLSKLYKQAALFQALGQQMEKYLGCIEDMQSTMTELHSTIANYFGTLSPPHSTFIMLLEDQNELWSLLEQDIVKLGEDFQRFARDFHDMLKKKESFRERTITLSKLRHDTEIAVSGVKYSTREKIKASEELRLIETELCKDTQNFQESLKEFDNRQRNFLVSHYKKFIDAHSEYTKDAQEIMSQIPDALRGLKK